MRALISTAFLKESRLGQYASPPMNQLIHLLTCPVCNLTLAAPTTLHCGHSICSHHSAVCCPQNPHTIPAQSRVTLNPAPPAPITALSLTRASDVTLTSILALVQRQNEDGDDRPRKRRRRHLSPGASTHQPLIQDSSHDDDGDGDLLTHLRNAAAHQRSIPIDVPPIQDSTLSDFDKKLLEELTCHICYVLFYRPVTTPCQHVRHLSPLSPIPILLYYPDLLFQMSTTLFRLWLKLSYLSTRNTGFLFPRPPSQ